MKITNQLWLKLQVILLSNMFILIEPSSTHNYITPRVVDIFYLKKLKNRKPWLVQLPIGTKRKVSEVVDKCPLVMNGLSTCINRNVNHLVPMMSSSE